MSAELTQGEAREQLLLWTTKFTEAQQERDRYDRLAQGYARMVEGLKLIHPEISDEGAQMPIDIDVTAELVDETTPHMRTDRAVLGVLGDLQEGVYQSAQWIVDEIDRRGWVLDSADPVVVVRKFLNKAQKQGRVIYRDLDGRTKGYRLPATTPGDVVDATSPGSVTTQRAGGDNHAEPPATAQDHDPTLSGRNDRDLNRETPERVAIQF